jgi:hypothetical protein
LTTAAAASAAVAAVTISLETLDLRSKIAMIYSP